MGGGRRQSRGGRRGTVMGECSREGEGEEDGSQRLALGSSQGRGEGGCM